MADADRSNLHHLQLPVVEVQVKPEGRECRKGCWTLHETLVLIAAKKLEDDRRLELRDSQKGKYRRRAAEVRWKRVENYCWKFGCMRSQTQCSDKWDNLLRDYKKVRDYELRNPPEPISYWQMEKHERKEKGLPSNLLKEVYCALHDVSTDSRFPCKLLPSMFDLPQTSRHVSPILKPTSPIQQHGQQPSSEPDPDLSEGDESNSEDEAEVAGAATKRRKLTNEAAGAANIAPSMFKSTVEIMQTLLACEDKKDRRHRDLLGVEERKLHIEEAKTEISRAGVAGLITAVNTLASAILILAADTSTATLDVP